MPLLRGWLQTIVDSFLVHDRKETIVALSCVLAAIILWFINALGQSYTTQVEYPVHFQYDSLHYRPLRPLPARLCLQLSGQGWQLLKIYVANKPSTLKAVFPANRLVLYPAQVTHLAAQALPSLQVQLMQADTLYFASR